MEASPQLGNRLHPELPYTGAEVVWAAREEMAIHLEDVLARRTRALFLNARAALEMAPAAADLLARELGRDDRWKAAQLQSFAAVARNYMLSAG
jgi:glycerol-3-phosphate dehydrogenase